MTRVAALFILSLLASNAVPAFAQSNSELLGGPGQQAAQEEAARRAAARKVEDQLAQARARAKRQADQAAADQAAVDRQADARKAEDARLARQAEDLEALETRLKAKEEELAAEEERLAQLRAEIEDEPEIAEAPGEPRYPSPERPSLDGPLPERPLQEWPALDDRPVPMRLDASIRSCAYAGEDRALSRDYISARYVRPPRLYRRQDTFDELWQLRGVMRLEEWEGYRLTDTICELDRNGRVQFFSFVR